MIGWVKIHRKITEWEWYNNISTRLIFLDLLFNVNYESKMWQGIEIKRGQLVTSISKLATNNLLSNQQTRSALNNLQTTNEITIKTTNKYSLVTLVNFDKYQELDTSVTSKTTSKITNEQQTINKQSNKQSTSKVTTTKEYKNIRNKEYSNRVADKSAELEIMEHWSLIVAKWFAFYKSQTNSKPTFAGADSKNLKEVVKKLKKVTIDAGFNWEEPTALKVVDRFFENVKNDTWLKENLTLPNLNSKFDIIINQRKDGTKSGNSNQSQKQPYTFDLEQAIQQTGISDIVRR